MKSPCLDADMGNSGHKLSYLSNHSRILGLIFDNAARDDFSSSNQIEDGRYVSLASTRVEDMMHMFNFINDIEGIEQDSLQPTNSIELLLTMNDNGKRKLNNLKEKKRENALCLVEDLNVLFRNVLIYKVADTSIGTVKTNVESFIAVL